MGLGPPVCTKCMVVGRLSNEKGWHCVICGSTNLKANLWTTHISEEELESNYRFYKFFKDFPEE